VWSFRWRKSHDAGWSPKAFTLERARYWEAVAARWKEARPQRLWRVHHDAVNSALLARWLPAGQVGRLLKTDLFDEAFGDGLYPLLSSRAHSVAAVDLSALTVATARSRYPSLQALQADVRY
jgi:hypothetical protein